MFHLAGLSLQSIACLGKKCALMWFMRVFPELGVYVVLAVSYQSDQRTCVL